MKTYKWDHAARTCLVSSYGHMRYLKSSMPAGGMLFQGLGDLAYAILADANRDLAIARRYWVALRDLFMFDERYMGDGQDFTITTEGLATWLAFERSGGVKVS